MRNNQPHRIKTVSEFHQLRGLQPPDHPLISVVNVEAFKHSPDDEPTTLVLDYYSISLKRGVNTKIKYGRQEYDFDEGIMFFIAPGQVFSVAHDKEEKLKMSGWLLLIHPDFLWNTHLAKKIRQYEYFNYSSKEALFLSEKEETVVTGIVRNVEQEYKSNIDKFSQDIIIAQLELLLAYAEKFTSVSLSRERSPITKSLIICKTSWMNISIAMFQQEKVYLPCSTLPACFMYRPII